jgi:hypothetical protein
MKEKENDMLNAYTVGINLINSAIKMDLALAELLKVEVSNMKKLIKSGASTEELQKLNIVVRNVILGLVMTEEKIRSGIMLCNSYKQQQKKAPES